MPQLKLMYNKILKDQSTIKTVIQGSYDLASDKDSIFVFLDWWKYNETYVIKFKKNRLVQVMKDGKSDWKEYML